MNISLTPVLEEMVRAKVESGYYNNASEVIREALRLMETNELLLKQAKLKLLQEHLQEGLNKLQQGKVLALSNADDVVDLFTAVKHGAGE